MSIPEAIPSNINFDHRDDWETFPSDSFPMTGDLIPDSGSWTGLKGAVWSEDATVLKVDDIAVTNNGGATWSIDCDFTATLTSGVDYLVVVTGKFGASDRTASTLFTMQ